jgi:capsular polysaccharide biosynthesis protein
MWLSTSDYLSRFPARWHPVEQARPLTWPVPRRFGSIELDFHGQAPPFAPEFGVLELERGRVFGKHGWVIGDGGILLPELSWYGTGSERTRLPDRLAETLRLEGTCLTLVSDWSSSNYAHFLLDGLGRLGLYRAAAESLPEFDHVLCPLPPTAAAAPILDKLGLPSEKIVWAPSDRLVQADILLAPSCPMNGLTYQPWLPRFLRRLTPESAGKPNRRLYVSRSGSTRQTSREKTLRSELEDRRFEAYEPSDSASQPDDFNEAAVVVGAHGAGLANLVFCRPGTKVLELVPTDNAYPFYYSLSLAAGLDYAYLAGRSTAERPKGTFGPSPHDFEVNVEDVAAAVDEWLA